MELDFLVWNLEFGDLEFFLYPVSCILNLVQAKLQGGVFVAVPKRKSSRSRRDKRRANWKATAPTLVECPQCHELKRPHHVCPFCGTYDGKEVIKVE